MKITNIKNGEQCMSRGPYQTNDMVIIWEKREPYMAHIWKFTGYIKSKYGFYNKHVLSTYSKYGVYMDTQLKTSIMWE